MLVGLAVMGDAGAGRTGRQSGLEVGRAAAALLLAGAMCGLASEVAAPRGVRAAEPAVVSLPVQPWQPRVPVLLRPTAPPWSACRGCDLRRADLRGLLLTGVDLRGADLRGADLRGSNLEGADLTGANLRGARLAGAWLSNADLSEADLRDADLRDAVVIQALTPGVQLEGAVLVGAQITGSDLVIGGPEERVPPLPPLPGLPGADQKPRR